MRTQTLKTYVKSKLTTYYNKPLRFKTLLVEAEKDQRLADLAQAYYLTLEEQEKADAFATHTKARFVIDSYASSNQKYARQFNQQKKGKEEYNEMARKRLDRVFNEEKLSAYKVAKKLGVHQSNLNEFYKKKKDTKMNADRVFKVFGF